jgi:hypothetical protein
MNELLVKGKYVFVKNSNDDSWTMREFAGVTTKNPFKYITYDRDSDEVEEWLIIKTPKSGHK